MALFFLRLSFLLFMLNTFYFYSIEFPIIQLIGLLCFLFSALCIGYRFRWTDLQVVLILISIIIISFLINSIYTFHTKALFSLLGLLLSLYVFLLLLGLSVENKCLYKVINFITIISLIFWFIQFGCYYFFHYKLDYFLEVTGYVQRDYKGLSDITLYRPSGLFVEPAMYGNASLLLIYARLLYNNFKFDLINVSLLLTIAFIFSSYTYIAFFILLLGVFVVRFNVKIFLYCTFMVVIFIILVLLFDKIIFLAIFNRLIHPLSDISGTTRILGGLAHFSEMVGSNGFYFLLGFGWGNAQYFLQIANGIYYIIFNAGILGLLAFLLLGAKYAFSGKYKALTLIVVFLALCNNFSVLMSFFHWGLLACIFRFNFMKVNSFQARISN